MSDRVRRPLVGVAVILIRDGRVLLGKRKNAHGAGHWALPGGHLEFGERVIDCARREVLEETGLRIRDPQHGPYTDDFFEAEGRHYATLFVVASCPAGEAQVLEPHKCEGWDWFSWDALPQPRFLSLRHLEQQGYVPDGC